MTNFEELQTIMLEELHKVDTDDINELRKKFDETLNYQAHGMTAGEQEQFFLTLVGQISGLNSEDVTGLNVLEEILRDGDVTEIMVNGLDGIFVERRGKLERADARFNSHSEIMALIYKLTSQTGYQVDERNPIADIRLADGSRLNIVLPPVALNGPLITIRKLIKRHFTWEDLIKFGAVTEPMAQFLEACVKGRLNVMVSGGTGSGKTTLLNALTHFINPGDRVVSIEEYGDLDNIHPHMIKLEARAANFNGEGAITVNQLIENALKMRADRIVISEVRGAEAWGLLTAMSTGHEGSMFAIHANSIRDSLMRLESMVTSTHPSIPVLQVRDRIANTLDVIVQQTRLADGSRKIIAITEVVEIRNGMIELRDIFNFEQDAFEEGRVVGKAVATGIVPNFMDKLHHMGIEVSENLFTAS